MANPTITARDAFLNNPLDSMADYGLDFDGAGDSVNLGSSATINPTNNFTIEFWCKFATVQAAAQFCNPIGKGHSGTAGVTLQPDKTIDNSQYWHLGTGSGLYSLSYGKTAAAFFDGNWRHYALTKSSTAGMAIYYDGAPVASNAAYTAAINWGTGDFYLGTCNISARALTGSMDEIRLYSRGLSATEIVVNYAGGAGLAIPYSKTDLKFWLPLRGETVTALDYSGGGFHGTITNAVPGTGKVSAWTDVSADLMSFSTRRGKNHELNREEAGTATVQLLNTGGHYWPGLTTGRYYGYVSPKKRINIRATWDSTTYNLYTGFIESWRPSFSGKPDKVPVMTLTCSDGLKYLAGYNLNSAKTGTCTNGTGTCTGSPVTLDESDTTITVTVQGTFTVVIPTGYTGIATSGTGVAITDSPKALAAGSNTITATGTGTFTITVNHYAVEKSGTRIGNVLDYLGWPAADRDIDTGISDVLATGLIANESGISHLQDVQDAEMGILFVTGAGNMKFADRHARLVDATSITSQAIFAIDDDDEQLVADSDLILEDTYIKNDVRVTAEGGAEQVETDSTSQTAYGKATLSKTGLLLTTDTEAADQAAYLLARYKDPAMRIKSLVIKPGVDASDLYPKALGYDIGHRITINLDMASIAADYFIEHIQHDWRALQPEALTTRWMLTSASTELMWVLGDATYGVLGSTTVLGY